MDHSEEKLSIEKLNGNNWVTWKFQIEHLLRAKDLWKFVDGTEKLKVEATPVEQNEHKAKAQKAFSTIVIAIKSSQLYLITSCKDPIDAWEKLKTQFERNSLSNKIMMKKQYFRAAMAEDTSMEDHLKEMKILTDRLAAIGAPISNEDQVVTLLGSVPESYSGLVTALEVRGDQLNLSEVQQALLQEEMKRRGVGEAGRQHLTDSALVGSGNGPRGKKWSKGGTNSNSRFGYKCYRCGKVGHMKRDCKVKVQGESGHQAKVLDSDSSDSDAAFVLSDEDGRAGNWLVDSGASSHMTSSHELLHNYEDLEEPQNVRLGDGRIVKATGTGTVMLEMFFKDQKPISATLCNVLYVPDLASNLLSVRAVTLKGYKVEFDLKQCYIKSASGKLKGTGKLVGKLYHLNCRAIVNDARVASSSSPGLSDIDRWHARLGHVNGQRLKEVVTKGLVDGIDEKCGREELSFCDACVIGKMGRKPNKPVGEVRSTRRLQLVHTDVCGPMQTVSHGGSKYYVTFTDDFSRYCSVYFMTKKSEVFEKFKEFELEKSNECGCGIGTLRSDNGGEYMSSEFRKYLKSRGIRHETTVAHAPEQNGVSERMNRTLVESARSMLEKAGLPKSFWAEAVHTACYTRNRLPTSNDRQCTPYQKWFGKKPNVKHMRIFGCISYAHVPDCDRRKLDSKAELYRFVGYADTQKGYRLYSNLRRKTVVRRDVVFNELNFGNYSEPSEVPVDLNAQPSQTEEPEQRAPVVRTPKPEPVRDPVMPESEPEPEGRPQRDRRPPVRYCDEYADVHHVALCTTVEEALSSPQKDLWKEAMDSEFNSLNKKDTWDLVTLPADRKSIGCKWVLKTKLKSDGSIERYKARLVAKGYAQQSGIDYDETFSPVVRFSTLRTLLAFATENGLIVHQMDVVTAFLNGTLKEEVYMEQPDYYKEPEKEHLVCKLKRSLYGLKQAPRCWNTTFTDSMLALGFIQSTADPCLFVRRSPSLLIIAVYVDDLVLVAEETDQLKRVKLELERKFEMKDMGRLHYILGIRVKQNEVENQILLDQRQYILNLLSKYGMANANPVSTPSDPNQKLRMDDGISKRVDHAIYQSMVGSLLYCAVATRVDVAHAVAMVSKFNANPSEAHMTAVKRILRYLKGTLDFVLKYEKTESPSLIGYCDADWAGDLDTRRSTSGQVFLMANGSISWRSKRQTSVSLSTAEAEYIALCSASQEAIWLKRLLGEIGFDQSEPITILEDNQSAIAMSKNPTSHDRTKHIDIKFHFVRNAINESLIKLVYCPTDEMVADILTKPLHRGRFELLRTGTGICS